jgi:hypothetical protein
MAISILNRRYFVLSVLVVTCIGSMQCPLSAIEAIGPDGVRGSVNSVLDVLTQIQPQEVQPTAEPATLTRTELLDGQRKLHASVRSALVSFEYSVKRIIDGPNDMGAGVTPPNYSCKVTGAVDGAKQYIDFEDTTPGRREEKHDIVAFNGTVTKWLAPNSLEGSVAPVRSPGHTSILDLYFGSIPLLIGPDHSKTRESHPDYLPVALEFKEYEVLPKLESVDGHLCHVVSGNGVDFLWIDVGHGHSLRRRVRFDKGSAEGPVCIKYLLMFRDFIEADEDIWMPKSIELVEYAAAWAPESLRGQKKGTSSLRASEVSVNNIPTDLFDLRFPTATGVIDKTSDTFYYVPESPEDYEKARSTGAPIVNGVITGLNLLDRPALATLPGGNGDKGSWILLSLNIALVFVFAVLVIYKRLKGRPVVG